MVRAAWRLIVSGNSDKASKSSLNVFSAMLSTPFRRCPEREVEIRQVRVARDVNIGTTDADQGVMLDPDVLGDRAHGDNADAADGPGTRIGARQNSARGIPSRTGLRRDR
jgi:hypothetical protein